MNAEERRRADWRGERYQARSMSGSRRLWQRYRAMRAPLSRLKAGTQLARQFLRAFLSQLFQPAARAVGGGGR